MIKKSVTAVIILFLHSLAPAAFADDLANHQAYRITSYNLGALLDDRLPSQFQKKETVPPLLITGITSDVLTNELDNRSSGGGNSGTEGLGLSAEFQATRDLRLLGAFGLSRNLWVPDTPAYEAESSWEANLGIVYRFLDNLSYELHFGYMETGTLFVEKDTYSDVEHIIMISNRLSMSF